MSTSTDLIPLPQVREALISGRMPDVVDPDVVADMIADRLLRATSAEELFNAQGTTPTKQILGQPMTLRDCIFMPSEVDDAKIPIYAVLDLVDMNGVQHVVACGGRAVVIQCLRAKEEGWLPWQVKLLEAGKERKGRNRPLYLETSV